MGQQNSISTNKNMSEFIKSLTPDQRHEYATSYAVLALHDGGLPVISESIQAFLDATNNTEVPPFYPTLFANFLNSPDKVDALLLNPCTGAGSGGVSTTGGDEVAGEEKEEEKEE